MLSALGTVADQSAARPATTSPPSILFLACFIFSSGMLSHKEFMLECGVTEGFLGDLLQYKQYRKQNHGKITLGTPYHLAVITATLIHPEGFLGCWYGRGGEHLVWIQMNSPSHTACPWPYIPVALSSSDDLKTEGFDMLRSLAAALLSPPSTVSFQPF